MMIPGIEHAKSRLKLLASDKNIGRKWMTVDGERSVIGLENVKGEPRYKLQVKGQSFAYYFKPEDLEQEIIYDTKQLESRKRVNKEKIEQEARNREERSLDGYEDTLTKLESGKAVKALTESGLRLSGKVFNKRRDAIRHLVKNGYRVETYGTTRGLGHPINDSFYSQKDLGKHAISYAEHLIKNKTLEAADSGSYTNNGKTVKLIYYANRSTAQTVKPGQTVKGKAGYGKRTTVRNATPEEIKQLQKGVWLRTREDNKKPTDKNAKKTKYRPWLTADSARNRLKILKNL